ncbi:MAG: hypothetical protein H7336_10695 [Bacteriovorax sp.]|nr:hypothetical protein [Bacteriovorax sp.]
MTKKQKHPEKNLQTLIIVGPMKFPWKVLKNFLSVPDVRLIFIDGGSVHAEKFRKKTPHLLKQAVFAGDGDSSKRAMTLKKTSQNSSDLAFVLSKLKGNSAPEICLMAGFLGGRIDHQLFNLGEIALYLKDFAKHNAPLIQVDDKIVFVGAGTHTAFFQGRFSLASFESNQIKITGDCDYKSKNWLSIPPLSSRGVSNLGFGEIKIETKKPLAIIRD